ncbi:hypothetical protein DRN98_06755, partial [Methanosarcinales archaeon]
MSVTENLLGIPKNIGRMIVEAGAVIVCPLLGTDRFVRFCKERGLIINRERLIRLERLGLFAPVFRVRTPKRNTPRFYIPVRKGHNWFRKKWAWDTTGLPPRYKVPNPTDQTQEGYYSVFQIDYLHSVLQEMTLHVQMDGYLDCQEGENIDWLKDGESCMEYAKSRLKSLSTHEYRRSLALLCQFISNRYYPQTQSDQRTIKISHGSYSDRWICIYGHDWNWYEEVRNWDPRRAERLFDLTPGKLRHAYKGLAVAQAHCDPMERWYQLTQFVAVGERVKLKGDALRADTLRTGAHMLRLLYKDLYGDELPHPNEVTGQVMTYIPELEIRKDPRRHLEFVVNRFGLNPQPKLSLIV